MTDILDKMKDQEKKAKSEFNIWRVDSETGTRSCELRVILVNDKLWGHAIL